MKNSEKVWIARDKSGLLWAHPQIPYKDDGVWICDAPMLELDSSDFPFVKWEDDEPTEAYITLNEPPKEINWEQRRYEIVKDLIVSQFHSTDVGMRTFAFQNKEMAIREAIELADDIIKKLKGGEK